MTVDRSPANEKWQIYYNAKKTIDSGDIDNFHLFEKYYRALQFEDSILDNYVSKKGRLEKEEEMKTYRYCLEKITEYKKSN